MIQEINIQLPDSWKDITLKKYLELQNDLELYKDDPMATLHFTIYHLCGIDVEVINKVTKESHEKIKTALDNLAVNQELPLQRIIEIDGIEYGFEPNLSKIAYGAYVDITKFDSVGINKDWAKIMAILYRPVTKKVKDTYEIKAYDGNVDHTIFETVSMHVVFGCWFFFVDLQMDLVKGILNYTKGMLPPNIKQILVKSGEVIQQSLSSQVETYKEWMKSQSFH